jgi:hypothetical protein
VKNISPIEYRGRPAGWGCHLPNSTEKPLALAMGMKDAILFAFYN